MPERGATYVSGALTLTAGEPARQLLSTADGVLSVAAACDRDGATLTIANASGAALVLAGGAGSLDPGDNLQSLPVGAAARMLALQAASAPDAGGERLAATLYVTAESADGGALVIGQLLVRAIEPGT